MPLVSMRQLENPRDVPLFHVMQRRKRRAFDCHGNFARRVRTLLGRRGRLGNRIFGIDHGERQHLLGDTLARMTRGATALPAGRELQLLELLEAPERGSDSCESGGGESNKPRSYSNLSHARNSRAYRDPRVHRRLDHPGRHERAEGEIAVTGGTAVA